MKLLKVKDINGNVTIDVILVENINDLIYVETMLTSSVNNVIKGCASSPEPPYRYGHLGPQFKGIEKALFSYCIQMPRKQSMLVPDLLATQNDNPLLSMNEAFNHYKKAIKNSYEKWGHVYINVETGGIFYKNNNEIVDSKEINGFPDEPITLDNYKKSIYYPYERQ